MLAQTNLTMEEIADRCGYNSPVHFSRQFRKCTGYAPSKWRENALGENMVVTDEPGIYLTGTYGVRIEDTVLITKSGCITLTKSDKNYIIVDEVYFCKYIAECL